MPQKIGRRLERPIGAEPDGVIVGDSGNFLSDLYVAQGLTVFLRDGYEVRIAAPEEVANSITPEVAVVTIAEVDNRTARGHDMSEIIGLARASGALMPWDRQEFLARKAVT